MRVRVCVYVCVCVCVKKQIEAGCGIVYLSARWRALHSTRSRNSIL